MSHPALTLKELTDATSGKVAAIRSFVRLEPAGGPGDKLFPPTYQQDKKATTKYAAEERRLPGRPEPVMTVLLDSVASQANRMEEALLEGWRADDLPFPLLQVDFSEQEELSDLEQITALQAPHRIADAIFRDSLLEDVPFRVSSIGKEFTESRVGNATAVYKHCPTALVFGVWDSTGPKGGLGSKFQRALVSEVVGIDAVFGKKTASRLDPLAANKDVKIYHAAEDVTDWTPNEADAKREGKKGEPVPFSRKKKDKDSGKPASINHGNIPPQIDTEAGGVTIDHALQTVVLSIPALRRLRFPTNVAGKPLEPGPARIKAETAARTALAALALAGVVYQRANGYDLRSRCLLVPAGEFVLELLPAEGGESQKRTLDRAGASKLLKEAHEEAKKLGFGWARGPITLTPAPKLAHLVRESRRLHAQGQGDDEGDEGTA